MTIPSNRLMDVHVSLDGVAFSRLHHYKWGYLFIRSHFFRVSRKENLYSGKWGFKIGKISLHFRMNSIKDFFLIIISYSYNIYDITLF